MSENVVPLDANRSGIPSMEPRADVVAILETLLADARSGNLRAIALCAISSNRAYFRESAGDCWTLEMVGAAALLLADISKEVNESFGM